MRELGSTQHSQPTRFPNVLPPPFAKELGQTKGALGRERDTHLCGERWYHERKVAIEPDNISPCPPQRRGLPVSVHSTPSIMSNVTVNNIESFPSSYQRTHHLSYLQLLFVQL